MEDPTFRKKLTILRIHVNNLELVDGVGVSDEIMHHQGCDVDAGEVLASLGEQGLQSKQLPRILIQADMLSAEQRARLSGSSTVMLGCQNSTCPSMENVELLVGIEGRSYKATEREWENLELQEFTEEQFFPETKAAV
ncbi:hypothetical protein JTB14_011164 [Gonioctena quinquepunctata]|nr:hypothetical protein JTB14_011164 [Gonioctena quinquepunctata]